MDFSKYNCIYYKFIMLNFSRIANYAKNIEILGENEATVSPFDNLY